MSKSKAMNEMLAAAFADMKTGRRVIEEISKENRSLADRFGRNRRKNPNYVICSLKKARNSIYHKVHSKSWAIKQSEYRVAVKPLKFMLSSLKIFNLSDCY